MSDLLNSASLVMIPSGYKEDTVYSVVPSDGSGDLSFTRASNGTRVNSAGLVEVCPWNLLQYSEDFANAVWTKKSTISLTANATTAPNGTNTATRMYANSNSAVDYGVFEILSSQSAALSVYAKKGELNYIYLGFNNDTASEGVFFNLNTGAISQNTGGYTASIESVGNGWYRCVAYFPTISYCFISPSVNGTSFVFSNQNNNGLFIWGAQLNIGSTAKPYFPTTDRLNVPRLTYQNGGGGCPSLLLEKQSTNSQTYSEQIDNGVWGLGAITISANNTTSPDGTQNADKVVETATTARHELYGNSLSFNGNNAISFYAKYAGRQFFCALGGGGGNGATFDLVNGTVATNTAVSASIESVGNGWYRCIVIINFTGTNQMYYILRTTGSVGIETYTGDGTSGVYFWGAQAESGSYPTSYIPTTSSSATRVADACFKTGISSLIGQTSGVLFVDFYAKGSYDSNNLLMLISSGSGGEIIYLNLVSGTIEAYIAASSAVQFLYAGGTALTANTRHKLAIAYANNDIALYHNGTQLATDTSASIPACTLVRVGDFLGGLYQFGNMINQAVLFKTRLSNAELASLTTI